MHPIINTANRQLIEAFNSKPKDGIAMIKEKLKGQPNVDVEKEIAEFFFANKDNLDLEAVGDYLGGGEPENKKVLTAFTSMIDLKGDFTDGLRVYLKSFKLPGEGQKIDRLMESFGTAFYEQNPTLVADKDAAYLLSYQTVMINTSLHNPSIKESEKYTPPKVKSILRGSNGGGDYPEDLLDKIFTNVKERPFEYNFVKNAPGYEFNSAKLSNDPTFNKVESLFQKASPKDIFPGIGSNVVSTIDKPKSWIKRLFGYEGTFTLTDPSTSAAVTVQVYKPGTFSKFIMGENPKIIIQPVMKDGLIPKASLDLSAQIASNFKSPVTVTATYNYEKSDLKEAISQKQSQNISQNKNPEASQTTLARKFSDKYKALRESVSTGPEMTKEKPNEKTNDVNPGMKFGG